MLALRGLRSPLLTVARRPFLAARLTQSHVPSADSQEALLSGLENDLGLDSVYGDDDLPPSAGDSGYGTRGPVENNPIRNASHAVVATPKKPIYRLHCVSSRNNTHTSFTDEKGNLINWFSGGRCQFKRSQRASYEAGYQCAVRIFKDIETVADQKDIELAVFLKGFGQGREALQKALVTSEGEKIRMLVSSITDRSPIKIGGTRAKKARRL